MMKVENMNGKTGKVANQFVITDKTKKVFQSYSSMIVSIDYEAFSILIGRDWDYSVTTGKYRNQFFAENGFSGILDSKKLLLAALAEGVVKSGVYVFSIREEVN